MSIAFAKDRGRFVVQWRDKESGKRRGMTLWPGATREDAEAFHAKMLDPLWYLREALERAASGEPDFGYVYAISNESLPGLFKIGKTASRVKDRILAFNTAHPYDWEVAQSMRVAQMSKCESILHSYFSEFRIHPRREFFKLNTQQVVDAFDLCRTLIGAPVLAKDLHR